MDYPPIEDYGAVGNGRTVALISRGGSVDWWCVPDLDSPSVFGAALDTRRGGRCELAPAVPGESSRRYVEGTNVLETTHRCGEGVVRVTDALSEEISASILVRRVEGLAGEVPVTWTVAPRFDYGREAGHFSTTPGIGWFRSDELEVAVQAWALGDAEAGPGSLSGGATLRTGDTGLLAVRAGAEGATAPAGREETERRARDVAERWLEWSRELRYEGPWREAVLRSALALKLLIHGPTGGIAAAGTSSLPEAVGAERNWDYRFAWIRDSSFTVDALLELGAEDDALRCFHWFASAAERTHPRLDVLYPLTEASDSDERELPLDGYRGSRPVRAGNGAASQLQLGIYGDLLQTAFLVAELEGALDRDVSRRLGELADHILEIWREPDAGIWEIRDDPSQFTLSKMLCAIGLERAAWLARNGHLPAHGAERWEAGARAVHAFVEERCWSTELGAYLRAAGSSDLDCAVLAGFLMGYRTEPERIGTTVDALRADLAVGPLLYRYRADDGLQGQEGAFVACGFWLAQALAEAGRVDEAAEQFESMLGYCNDVGLYSEEIDPSTGAFLGNIPQGLSHFGLINAAVSLSEYARG